MGGRRHGRWCVCVLACLNPDDNNRLLIASPTPLPLVGVQQDVYTGQGPCTTWMICDGWRPRLWRSDRAA